MYIKTIELKDFRNYKYLKLECSKNINLVYGNNAQGKTNILEAINIASTAKSHRGSKDDDLIRISDFSKMENSSQEEITDSHIKILLEKEFTEDRIDIHIKKNKSKGIAVNGISLKRTSDLFGYLQIVFFYPEDLDIIRRGPSVRRHFLDIDISRIKKVYLNALIDYNKTLEGRNKLLKKMSLVNKIGDEETLDILDIQLVKYGKLVYEERLNYLKKINSLTHKIHQDISNGKEKLEIIYEPNIEANIFEKALKDSRKKDKRFGITHIGPHRDDFSFYINGKDVKKFGSQGQKRSAALSLKLAEIDIAKEESGEMPVLLLDDVLSELDSLRQEFLLKRIGNMQTFITCTGQDDLITAKVDVDRFIYVEDGNISVKNQEV